MRVRRRGTGRRLGEGRRQAGLAVAEREPPSQRWPGAPDRCATTAVGHGVGAGWHDGVVPDRLSALDASFLYLEQPTTAMHVGTVMVFEPPHEGFDHAELVTLVAGRIAYAPRYRQRVRTVPGRLANPVWVDDEDFDVNYHVRRSALPSPGTQEQAADFVARVQSRRLDRARPLWEVYLVEGLQDGRFAIVTKTHQALVDGVHALDIAQVILEESPEPAEPPVDTWRPAPEPTDAEPARRCGGGRRAQPRHGARHPARRGRRRAGDGRTGLRSGSAASPRRPPARPPARRRPARSTSTSASSGATRWSRPPRRPPRGAGPARSTGPRPAVGQRRGARHRGRRAAHLAAGSRRVRGAGDGGPRARAGQRAGGRRRGRRRGTGGVRGARGRGGRSRRPVGRRGTRRQPGRGVRRRPAGRRGEPVRAAAPDRLRDAGARRGRWRGGGAGPRRARRLRAAHPALHGCPRRQRRVAAAVQPDRDQRAGPAAAAVRRTRRACSPRTRWCRWPRARP
nr:wax ester/triacylglycerol synthase domain-containing protein [Angustibacter aerolatus]